MADCEVLQDQCLFGMVDDLTRLPKWNFDGSSTGFAAEVSMFGIEQEYTLLKKEVNWPIGWPTEGYPGLQVSLYISLGSLLLWYWC
ncbi:hypothetical protein ACET3Z_029184 [Daucus carota]